MSVGDMINMTVQVSYCLLTFTLGPRTGKATVYGYCVLFFFFKSGGSGFDIKVLGKYKEK